MQKLHPLMIIGLLVLMLTGCDAPPQKKLQIALNPWPGYEFLYLAEYLGYFDDYDVPAELVQLSSLADVQRAYLNGRVDGIASTLIEVVQINELTDDSLQVLLAADYSDGSDVLVAEQSVTEIQQLKGKIIGCEMASLGIYLLYRALEHADMTLDDVTLRNVEQLSGAEALAQGEISALVSYPPTASRFTDTSEYRVLYHSGSIPYEILDVVSVNKAVLADYPDLQQQLMLVWQKALDYTAEHPQAAYEIMARRENITVEEFVAALEGIKVLSLEEQPRVLEPARLEQAIATVRSILFQTGTLLDTSGP